MNPLCPLFRFWKWIHWMNPLCPRNRLNRVQPTMDPWMFFEFAVGFIRFWIRQWIRYFLVGSIVGSIFFFESVNESVFFCDKIFESVFFFESINESVVFWTDLLMNLLNESVVSSFHVFLVWIRWMNPLCPFFTFFGYESAEWIRFVLLPLFLVWIRWMNPFCPLKKTIRWWIRSNLLKIMNPFQLYVNGS